MASNDWSLHVLPFFLLKVHLRSFIVRHVIWHLLLMGKGGALEEEGCMRLAAGLRLAG